MGVRRLLNSLAGKLLAIETDTYQPQLLTKNWEHTLGVMDEDMKRAYSRITQISKLCELAGRQGDELELIRLNLELTLHEALFELLLFEAFPEIFAEHKCIDLRYGWKLIVPPPEEDAFTPEERYEEFSAFQNHTIH